MSSPLRDLHIRNGAKLASDGIPLHFGDLAAEYSAAHSYAVLLDRSHEGRLLLRGRDHIGLMQRMSTNQLEGMSDGEGRPTIFTTSNGRILDRVMIYRQSSDQALVITEPSRATAFQEYLQKHIFFNDQVTQVNTTDETAQFTLHGVTADAVVSSFLPETAKLPPLHGHSVVRDGISFFIARGKPIIGTHWVIVAPRSEAAALYELLLQAGSPHGLISAGGLTYNTLCVEAGRPMLNRELNSNFIPLEVGLWDEVNFAKGCYTGQEIIARMESRNKLAKTLVRFTLDRSVSVPSDLLFEEKRVGILTSCVTTPDGSVLGLGLIKPHLLRANPIFTTEAGDAIIRVIGTAGVQPAQLATEDGG